MTDPPAPPLVAAVQVDTPIVEAIPIRQPDVPFDVDAAAVPQKKKRASGVPVPRWTPEEEVRLQQLVEELGEKAWEEVAERLGGGRSGSGIDQHWCARSFCTPAAAGGRTACLPRSAGDPAPLDSL